MAEDQFEKTEPATPRQRKQFREKGQVAKSKEITTLFTLLGCLVYFYFFGAQIFEDVANILRTNFDLAGELDLDAERMQALFVVNIELFARIVGPFFVMILVLTLLPNVVQTGWLFTAKPLAPDLTRIDPISNFKQKFLTIRLFTDTGINILKIGVLAAVVYMIISNEMQTLMSFLFMSELAVSRTIMMTILDIMLKTILFFIVVAAIDFAKQWHQLEQQMRMTKQQVKDEFKDTEGNPQVKGQMRQRMREISMNNMIESVPQADVVVTNPTHLAIAIQYDPAVDAAPKVVAKGQGFWAERIKIIARESGVEVVEDKLLARAMFKTVKIGQSIPSNFYRAVAELLAQVYKLNKERGKKVAPRRPVRARA